MLSSKRAIKVPWERSTDSTMAGTSTVAQGVVVDVVKVFKEREV